MANPKFFVRGTKAKFDAIADKSIYANSIVFLTDTKLIYLNGVYYGLSTEDAEILNNVKSDLEALKYFETVTGNTGSASAPGAGSTLNIKGNSGITTAVAADGVTITHTNTVTAGTASGDANKTLTFGGTFTIPSVTYDAQGHITGKSSTTMTMPANPDTHHQAKTIVGASATAKANAAVEANPFLNLVENNTVRSTHLIKGEGKVRISSDASGNITITGAKATVAEGTENGKITVDDQSVKVHGLGSAAYTDSSAYATSALGTLADNAVPNTRTINGHLLNADIELKAGDVGLGNVENKSVAAMFTSPTFTGIPSAPTATEGTNTTLIATTEFVTTAVNKLGNNVASALRYAGTIGTGGTITSLPANHNVGDVYIVKTAGNFAGEACEEGDMIICHTTGETENNDDWQVIQTNINGAVTASSPLTSNAVIVGNGNKVVKLASTVGAANKGIYFENGVPKTTSHTVEKDVPSNAVFTDTKVTAVGNHYKPASGTAMTVPAATASLTFGTDAIITGINADAAGHITAITAKKLPSYTFANGTNGSFTVTPTNGTALTVTIGKPASATAADKLVNERTITIDGDASGSTKFNGSKDVTINLELAWEEL